MGVSLSSTISNSTIKSEVPVCFHCGLKCLLGSLRFADKNFCCQGCVSVFELLNEKGLQNYYNLEQYPGSQQVNGVENERYQYLDDKTFQENIFEFKQDNVVAITFKIKQIHCASCVWLLEHIHQLQEGILTSRVNFLNRTMRISFDLEKLPLSVLVMLLSRIGYEPEIKVLGSDVENGFLPRE